MNKLGLSLMAQYVNGSVESLKRELLYIENSGADCCELVLHGLDVVVGGHLLPHRAKRVIAALRERDLEYTIHLPHDLALNDEATAQMYEAVFLASIEFAQMAGARVIVFHAGMSKQYNKDAFLMEAERVRKIAEKASGTLLCIENPLILSDGIFTWGDSAKSIVQFCDLVNMPNLKITFDIGHYYLHSKGSREELLGAISTALPHIGHVHLHDNFGKPTMLLSHDYGQRIASGVADLHLPPGWGAIPVKEALNALKGFGGIINLEIEKRFCDEYASSLSLVRRILEERDA
ncbi:MAG: sugar phosphate isomerase/epimerase [Clostridiales bacterium]|jgi:sugar phosphate isomerase/epimerase|nr:sugar phosphate isomerase/epimerase [Clostridiales bacterium]